MQMPAKLCKCQQRCSNANKAVPILPTSSADASKVVQIPISNQADSLNAILDELILTCPNTIVTGDFNLPLNDWKNCLHPSDGVHDCFFEFMSSRGMHQTINEPTRFDSIGTCNTLDLLFSNDPYSLDTIDLLDPFSTSDHLTISFSIFFLDNKVDPCSITDQAVRPDLIKLSVYNWSAANFDAINAILGTLDWHQLFGYHFGADSMWYYLATHRPICSKKVSQSHRKI